MREESGDLLNFPPGITNKTAFTDACFEVFGAILNEEFEDPDTIRLKRVVPADIANQFNVWADVYYGSTVRGYFACFSSTGTVLTTVRLAR